MVQVPFQRAALVVAAGPPHLAGGVGDGAALHLRDLFGDGFVVPGLVQALPQNLQRFVVLAHADVHVRHAQVRRRVRFVQRRGLLIVRQGRRQVLRRLAAADVGAASPDVGLGPVGLDLDGRRKGDNGLLVVPLAQVFHAQVILLLPGGALLPAGSEAKQQTKGQKYAANSFHVVSSCISQPEWVRKPESARRRMKLPPPVRRVICHVPQMGIADSRACP